MPQRPDRCWQSARFHSSASRFSIRAWEIEMVRMRDRRAWWPAAIAGVFLGLLLALPPVSSARKLQMSGTWAIRNGQVFIPVQFASTLGGTQRTMTSMGDLSKGFGFPNGPVAGAGSAIATGGTPATLVVPTQRFQSQASFAAPLAGISLVQIATSFVVDGPIEQAVLAPRGGPGSFTWCPNAALGCPATGPPNGGTRNGRVIYRAGPNQFGGSMRIGLARGGTNSFLFQYDPFRVGHVYFGANRTTEHAPAVGAGTASMPGIAKLYLAPGVVTQPLTVTYPGLILHPGPKLTTMLGLSTTGTGPVFRLPAIGTSAQGMSVGQSTTEFGFAHTTGTVIVQQTAGTAGDDFFTVMGSDMRTALGAGNISTVAGGLSFRNTLAAQTPYATFHKVWMSLAPPVPSLSPAGVAVAGVLLLLTVGYALRKRAGR